MKRRDSVLSSSSRRENGVENSIGCMSGIFQLVRKFQNRRKFLTLGNKQPKHVVISPKIVNPCSVQGEKKKGGDFKWDFRRLSSDVLRSSTEIRPSTSPENSKTPQPAAERKQKLLGALEKCDVDLKELKDIIEAIKSSEHVRSPVVVRSIAVKIEEDKVGMAASGRKEHSCGEGEDRELNLRNKVKSWEFNNEQPSPVSVLDEFTHSSLSSSPIKRDTQAGGREFLQQRKKPGEECNIYNIASISESLYQMKKNESTTSVLSTSCNKAMVESVDEACKDIAWGQKRELGRIGLTLQDHIYKDLIQDFFAGHGR